jgi:hypothetical protein
MLALAYILIAIAFPVVALQVRQRSARTLWLTTGAAVLAMLGLALVLASGWAGNRLVATEGYARVALGVVRLALFTFIFPIVAAAATVAALGERAKEWFAYPVALAVTLVGMSVGVVALFWLAN